MMPGAANMSPIESALVVLVPEAEDLAKPFRDQYDPSAADGMPAHITLLYPFKLSDQDDQAALDYLGKCFERFALFGFALASIRRFPDAVLYLAPEPDEPFRQLTLAIWDQYPESPPYGGKWPDIIPHLCLAWVSDEHKLDRIADDFARASQGRLPIRGTAAEVALMEKRSGRWFVRTTFALRRR
jgi:2'-5' RNA ligase